MPGLTLWIAFQKDGQDIGSFRQHQVRVLWVVEHSEEVGKALFAQHTSETNRPRSRISNYGQKCCWASRVSINSMSYPLCCPGTAPAIDSRGRFQQVSLTLQHHVSEKQAEAKAQHQGAVTSQGVALCRWSTASTTMATLTLGSTASSLLHRETSSSCSSAAGEPRSLKT